MVVQKPYWHAGMVGKEASFRSLYSTPSRRQIHLPHLRRPRGGPAAARVCDSKQELPGAILVQELRQLACVTASAAHGYGSWSGHPVQPRRVLRLFGYNTRPEILACMTVDANVRSVYMVLPTN
jgi:hypothetical protein